MKILLEGKEYAVQTEYSNTLKMIEEMLPLNLKMRRNHDVEFVGELPGKPVNDGRKISDIKPNGIYYYEGWNVLCLNYRDGNISPYTITYLGTAEDPELTDVLKRADDHIEVTVIR